MNLPVYRQVLSKEPHATLSRIRTIFIMVQICIVLWSWQKCHCSVDDEKDFEVFTPLSFPSLRVMYSQLFKSKQTTGQGSASPHSFVTKIQFINIIFLLKASSACCWGLSTAGYLLLFQDDKTESNKPNGANNGPLLKLCKQSLLEKKQNPDHPFSSKKLKKWPNCNEFHTIFPKVCAW